MTYIYITVVSRTLDGHYVLHPSVHQITW